MKISALLALLALSISSAFAQTATLTVNLHEVRAAVGNLRASLYRDPETFRKEDKAVQVVALPAVAGTARIVFPDLAPGKYAVMAYHDENSDGKLNLRLGMFPTEGYGLSNNPQVMGPPKFADSAFEISGPETVIDIKLAY